MAPKTLTHGANMTDTTTTPQTILDLRKAWEDAVALCEQIVAEPPRGELLFSDQPKRALSPEKSARLTQARFRKYELTVQLHRARKQLRTESAGLGAPCMPRPRLSAGGPRTLRP